MAFGAEINAGALDRRVTLLRPIYNAFEDEITGWEPITQVWAAVNPSTGQEIVQAGRTVGTAAVPIVIRYRADIDLRWRIEDGDRTYGIAAILDIARRHVQLQLTCEEIL